jgi:hypothetical protein
MLRRMVICLIIVGAGALFAASSSARERRHVDVTPFSHALCSVLSGECTPSTCSVFNHGPCIPEFYYPYYPYYPYGENLQVTIQSQPSQDDATKYQKPDHDLNTIGDLFAALRSCWSPPPADVAREGMQMSVLFSFNKSGSTCSRDDRAAAHDLRHARRPGGYPKCVSEGDQRVAQWLRAVQVHGRARRRHRWASDHDPLCR